MNIPDLNPLDYTVAWIAPLSVELAAAKALLDKRHMGRLNFGDKRSDCVFTAGEVRGHNIVIATLPDGQPYGNGSVASIASQLKSLFHNLWFGLLVGVAAGIPDLSRHPPQDIRLGDVLVASAKGNAPAVMAYSLGKELGQHGFQILRQGHALETAAPIVRSAISHIKGPLKEELPLFLPFYEEIKDKEHDSGTFIDLGQEKDKYYTGDKAVARPTRPPPERTRIWYGTIGSADTRMRYSEKRDALQKEHNLIGLEIGAAGALNCLPVGVIRGVCDYGDEHNNRTWQPYAAAMAGAYAKAILAHVTPWKSNQSPSYAMQNNIADFQSSRSKGLLADDSASERGDRSKRSRTEERDLGPHHPGALNAVSKVALLDSLAFQQIEARREDLGITCTGTCQWLLKTDEYQCWSKDEKSFQHPGVLWIKGKPGAGKSVLMNVALADAEKVERRTVIFFFFHARGLDLQRSTKGMYRALLHQLLTKLPRLQSVLPALKAKSPWSIQDMKVLFEKAVNNLGESPLMVFIDAIDECEEKEVRDTVNFFRDLVGNARENDIVFQVCFASRPYPNVTLREKIELLLDQQRGHSEDILTYVNHNLQIGTDMRAREIRTKLIEKAHGVFMWVKLVVEDLQSYFDGGKNYLLAERLKETPGDLYDLFFQILTHDEDSKDELRLCIQWMLFARQPLNATQLQHAILCGIEPQRLSGSCPLRIEESNAEKFILRSSKGLAEKTKPGDVQFIHESVRDFLLEDDRGKRVLETLQPDLGEKFEGKSHAELKRCCVRCIEISHPCIDVSILSLRADSVEAEQARRRETRDFPLMQYATDNVLHHADAAHGAGVNQTEFIEGFDLANWVKLANFLKKIQYRRYRTGQPSLLYVLSEHNAGNLIGCSPSNSNCFEQEDQQYGMPIVAAVATDSRLAVRALIKAHAYSMPQANPLRDEWKKFLQIGRQRGRGREIMVSRSQSVLGQLVKAGDESIVAFAIASGYDLNILKRLLESGAEPDKENEYSREAPLLFATKDGQADIVQLLLHNNANTEVTDEEKKTPLLLASERGDTKIVRVLLDYEADIEAEDRGCCTALIYAAAGGHKDIAQMLLDQGANIDCKSEWGTPLSRAVKQGQEDIVWLLLDKGAEADRVDSTGRTPLWWAIQQGSEAVVKLLLERPFDVVEVDNDDITPLWWAVKQGSEGVVKLLLQHGADANKGNVYGSSPLELAVDAGRGAIARLLLQYRANVDCKLPGNSTLLHRVVAQGNTAMVRMLLEFGAVADLMDDHGLTALVNARGRKDIVQLLQENRAITTRVRPANMPIRTVVSMDVTRI